MARKRNPFAPSEDDITRAALDHWRLLGLPDTLVASIPNKRAFGQAGLTRGLPDLLVLGPNVPGGVAFVELKRDWDSDISDPQRDFGKLCLRLGIPFLVAVGRDEPIGLLELWNVVRAQVPHDSSPRPSVAGLGMAKPGKAGRRAAKQGKDNHAVRRAAA